MEHPEFGGRIIQVLRVFKQQIATAALLCRLVPSICCECEEIVTGSVAEFAVTLVALVVVSVLTCSDEQQPTPVNKVGGHPSQLKEWLGNSCHNVFIGR